MSRPYKCRQCDGMKFKHEVRVYTDEIFDTEEKYVRETEPYADGDEWKCMNCGAIVPKRDSDVFLKQLYEANY